MQGWGDKTRTASPLPAPAAPERQASGALFRVSSASAWVPSSCQLLSLLFDSVGKEKNKKTKTSSPVTPPRLPGGISHGSGPRSPPFRAVLCQAPRGQTRGPSEDGMPHPGHRGREEHPASASPPERQQGCSRDPWSPPGLSSAPLLSFPELICSAPGFPWQRALGAGGRSPKRSRRGLARLV